MPFVFYVHPRDLDPDGPCLPLGRWGRFKFYVNRKTTEQKLAWLCRAYEVCTIREFAALGESTLRLRKDRDLVTSSPSQQAIQMDFTPQDRKTRRTRDEFDQLVVSDLTRP